MKRNNKKKIVIISIVAIIAIILIVLGIIFIKVNDSSNKQNIDNLDSIENIKLDNSLKLEKGSITFENGKYYLNMSAINNSNKEIDMTNYRISFLDENGNEIEWFSGAIIGKVPAKDTVNIEVEIYTDMTKLKTITYNEKNY